MLIQSIIGAGIGGVLGFVYYKKVGCPSGTCPITSNPFSSVLYGAFLGAVIANIF